MPERVVAVQHAVEAWLRGRAEVDLGTYTKRFTDAIGQEASGVALSDAKARWGSCSSARVIRVHWRLVQAPTPAFEYVVAHEVVHLRHRKHSPTFWRALRRILPEWEAGKALLERWEEGHRTV